MWPFLFREGFCLELTSGYLLQLSYQEKVHGPYTERKTIFQRRISPTAAFTVLPNNAPTVSLPLPQYCIVSNQSIFALGKNKRPTKMSDMIPTTNPPTHNVAMAINGFMPFV